VSISKNPVPGVYQEQQPSKQTMPNTFWSPADNISATWMHGGLVLYWDVRGRICLSPSVGWLENTTCDTQVSPRWQCSAHWAGTGLHWISAGYMEAACSCSGVHQQDSLITAMLWKRMSTRCEVVMGDACSQGIFYPLHRERGTGIGSGVGGRIC